MTYDGDEEALRHSIAEYSDAVKHSDAVVVDRYLADQFKIVFLYPAFQIVDRSEWLRRIPDFRLQRWDVQHELITRMANTAIHYRLADMRATAASAARNGLFCVTDCWAVIEGGWLVYERLATPLTAGPLPNERRAPNP